MDTARFIPCLIKTVNSYLRNAREYWDAHKEELEKMDSLPEYLCPKGVRHRVHNLYGTVVDICYDHLFIPCMQVKPTGISLTVSFEIDGFPHNFTFCTEDNEERVRKYFAHIFYCRSLKINRYLETLEEINETFINLSK